MNILAISGSASPKGSNFNFLAAIQKSFEDEYFISIYNQLSEFPLFSPDHLSKGIPTIVQEFKNEIEEADAVLISTPEYTHNIPAVLKNMIEWCTHSGEFSDKKIIPITFTPHAPRGEHAMQSLLFSLKALDAKVLTQFPIYKTDVEVKNQAIELSADVKEMLKTALELL
ncbi:NADPH-dependent FMN reductase [Brumimicrobium aurantiacum]|uniref:NAD(P)H-dependent oxidoreductase n=1 Tax=Brumimicrobium aurantiacum TaxID=1737063 RepID=A0A3E1EZP2_9FLAO|nr:NADPH-dependent FMN reductase [Brumimicrobium aurantiacum]RFC55024.1 NAD(P)H-dependent oxidoreductase [Brumimicrobium aurantiacum]